MYSIFINDDELLFTVDGSKIILEKCENDNNIDIIKFITFLNFIKDEISYIYRSKDKIYVSKRDRDNKESIFSLSTGTNITIINSKIKLPAIIGSDCKYVLDYLKDTYNIKLDIDTNIYNIKGDIN